MRTQRLSRKIGWLIIAALAGSASVRADQIVLKNGRKNLAYNVVEEGDKIRYETSAGQLSLPKSIVDHIEKGGLVPMVESPAAAAASLVGPPPEMEPSASGTEIDKSVVRDGVVDREFIARMENEAKSGGIEANERAALAHHAAAQFELSHGDMRHALDDEKAALTYAPGQPVLLMDTAYIYLKQSEFKESLEYLDRAKRAAPKNPDVYKLAGWAYSGMNRQTWQRKNGKRQSRSGLMPMLLRRWRKQKGIGRRKKIIRRMKAHISS